MLQVLVTVDARQTKACPPGLSLSRRSSAGICRLARADQVNRRKGAMFKHILLPTDGSELSERVIPKVVALAQSMSARLTGLIVFEPFHVFAANPLMVTDTDEVYRVNCERRAAQCLETIKRPAEAAGVDFDGVHVYSTQPYHTIITTAAAHGCDLICMASHGRRGVSALVLGSETLKVLTHSKIPVLVWR
jgi:nucleotide-binding universal stress UspA family protein